MVQKVNIKIWLAIVLLLVGRLCWCHFTQVLLKQRSNSKGFKLELPDRIELRGSLIGLLLGSVAVLVTEGGPDAPPILVDFHEDAPASCVLVDSGPVPAALSCAVAPSFLRFPHR